MIEPSKPSCGVAVRQDDARSACVWGVTSCRQADFGRCLLKQLVTPNFSRQFGSLNRIPERFRKDSAF
jgi:hypothetical protein